MPGERNRSARFALLCGAVSVSLGLLYLVEAAAPLRYPLINLGALALGVALAILGRRIPRFHPMVTGATTLAVGLLLVATALFGPTVYGASRWLRVGGVSLQPSLILMPMALVQFACRREPLSSVGWIVAAVALGLQPDRAMAGTLAAALLALWVVRRERAIALPLTFAVAAFASTLLRTDAVPPVPHVEQVVRSSFDVQLWVGLAVVAGLCVMLTPALADAWARVRPGPTRDTGRDPHLVFGVTWLAIALFAIIGHYPTPLVGYGASSILGYCLSAAALD